MTSENVINVGIDLGTSNSCAAIFINGHIDIIQNKFNEYTTPSIVYYDGEKIAVGKDAIKSGLQKPENVIFDTKRMVGRQYEDTIIQTNKPLWPFTISKNFKKQLIIKVPTLPTSRKKYLELLPEQILSEILKQLKSDITLKFSHASTIQCVITIPAYFNTSQRQAIERAANMANLKVLKYFHEPTAAALAAIDDTTTNKNRLVLIYDLGGGTFDVSLVKFTNGNGHVIRVGGDNCLGGRDFDNELSKYLYRKIEKQHKIITKSPEQTKIQLKKLRLACENAKKELSIKTVTNIELEFFGFDIKIELTRDEFDKINQKLYQKTIDIVKNVLKPLEPNKIDDIILVGGSTRISTLQRMISELFGKPPSKRVNPDEAVAKGAALMAYRLGGGKDTIVPTVKDATAHSIGIELETGEMEIIIEKNSTIPIVAQKIITTSVDEQDTIILRLYEGEEPIAKVNRLLGEFFVEGLAKQKKGGTDLCLVLQLDANNSLKMTAREVSREDSEELVFSIDF